MVEQRIIYTHPDDGVVYIVTPAYKADQTDEENVQRVISRRVPDGVSYRLVTQSEYDAEVAACAGRVFRDVWEDSGGALTVNMTRARTLHMNRIRVVRDAELVKKDVLFMRAIEAGDTDAQATIGTEKQTLRDIPATFDITTGVDTPAALHAKWPSELPARE